MKLTLKKIISALLLIVCGLAMQTCNARVEKEVLPSKTVVNLMDTDLVNKKDLLDCQLRVEGSSPHYKLIYSLGEVEIPKLAVKKVFDDSWLLLSVKATIKGMPISELFVEYHKDKKNPYSKKSACHFDDAPCVVDMAYSMTLDRPEKSVLSELHSHFANELIVESKMSSGNVNPGAVLIRDRANLMAYAMDGWGGAENKHQTELYYICVTE